MEPNPETLPEIVTACGGKIKETHLFPSARYQGRTVYFCTKACLEMFEKDPEPFMTGEIEHPAD